MLSATRTYVKKTLRPAVNVKSIVIYRVFGPGRTQQVDAVATPTEAVVAIESLVKAVPPAEPACFVAMRAGRMVVSVGLDQLALCA